MTEDTGRRAAGRTLLRAAGLAAIAPLALRVAPAAAQQKLAKNMVLYQDGPKDGLRCDACLHWQAPNACALIEGPINPAGWCAAYAPKGT